MPSQGSKSRSRTWLEKDEKDKAEAEDDKEPPLGVKKCWMDKAGQAENTP